MNKNFFSPKFSRVPFPERLGTTVAVKNARRLTNIRDKILTSSTTLSSILANPRLMPSSLRLGPTGFLKQTTAVRCYLPTETIEKRISFYRRTNSISADSTEIRSYSVHVALNST